MGLFEKEGGLALAFFLAQQVSQRDAPPVGGFEVRFFSRFGGFAKAHRAARPLP